MAKVIKNRNFSALELKTFCGASHIPLTIMLREYPESADLWHQHRDFAELVIVLAGSANNNMETVNFQLRSGDILLLTPQSKHRYSAIRKFRHYNLLLAPNLLSTLPGSLATLPNYHRLFVSDAPCSPILHLDEKELSAMVGLLESMRTEYLTHSTGWEEAMFIDFCKALIYLLRHATLAGATFGGSSFQIGRTIRYMEENSFKPFTLEDLCAYAQMSESSFRHHFRELTGLAPIEYLIRLRLRRAALTMIHSDHSITTIALEAGFSDGNYFARQFKMLFNRTPREFRRACLNGQLNLSAELDRLLQAPRQ